MYFGNVLSTRQRRIKKRVPSWVLTGVHLPSYNFFISISSEKINHVHRARNRAP